MGNRGRLHDNRRRLVTTGWRSRAWLICVLEFRGRHRTIMAPGHYTELFFLDEAVALAAGHRPCGECPGQPSWPSLLAGRLRLVPRHMRRVSMRRCIATAWPACGGWRAGRQRSRDCLSVPSSGLPEAMARRGFSWTTAPRRGRLPGTPRGSSGRAPPTWNCSLHPRRSSPCGPAIAPSSIPPWSLHGGRRSERPDPTDSRELPPRCGRRPPSLRLCGSGRRHVDDPSHAEAIRDHAEA